MHDLRLPSLLVITLFVLFPAAMPSAAGEGEGPAIAAAASLRDVLPKLANRFAENTGIRPRLSFGASGNLRRQIAQGAPFELFLSANETYVLELAREGHLQDAGSVYALGRLALLTPRKSPLVADGTLSDLTAAVKDGRLHRLAIANPEHAPYGMAARDALQRLNLWESVKSRLVIGENVGQAAQFAATGNAQGGIIAYSLAKSPRLRACCVHAPIPAQLHVPLKHRGALAKGAKYRARQFFEFLLGDEGREIITRGGFSAPASKD
jgi:molybdate transport system substrate-binding protein